MSSLTTDFRYIALYMSGVLSGIGIALAFFIHPGFFVLFLVGFAGYVVTLEKLRAKKNPPT